MFISAETEIARELYRPSHRHLSAKLMLTLADVLLKVIQCMLGGYSKIKSKAVHGAGCGGL
jgi:ABC-type sulfate transport system substrate-binding protein